MAKSKYKDKDKAVAPMARSDAYVMMLFITFVSIVAGCVLMYLDFDEYGKIAPAKEPMPSVQKLGDPDTKLPGDPAPAPK
jgi:hypothetical protein